MQLPGLENAKYIPSQKAGNKATCAAGNLQSAGGTRMPVGFGKIARGDEQKSQVDKKIYQYAD